MKRLARSELPFCKGAGGQMRGLDLKCVFFNRENFRTSGSVVRGVVLPGKGGFPGFSVFFLMFLLILLLNHPSNLTLPTLCSLKSLSFYQLQFVILPTKSWYIYQLKFVHLPTYSELDFYPKKQRKFASCKLFLLTFNCDRLKNVYANQKLRGKDDGSNDANTRRYRRHLRAVG